MNALVWQPIHIFRDPTRYDENTPDDGPPAAEWTGWPAPVTIIMSTRPTHCFEPLGYHTVAGLFALHRSGKQRHGALPADYLSILRGRPHDAV
jgi:hypothetical protein